MEDCCAVCAEPLEWVGYGPCGHREVCFTCIARLRFVLNDNRCCICKQYCSTVFITKALGEYTRVITDFSSLPGRANGNSGDRDLWYDSVVEAYFDDDESFKIVKAMCRLYCSVCENSSDDQAGKGFMKKGHTFKNIDALRRHHFISHKVLMCELCLEGRKVFICEQKLYTRVQLDRHGSRGDSEVDGSEEERGGFGGHPMCEFCRKRYYGDNELYQHMSQEHYTCHICQRARPAHFEYYRNYDDLESHFRQLHVLCEHPDCLAKKFVVFPSEAELKRHNATAHGGSMSRSQRNAALQLPVSFHFRRPGQDSTDDSGSGGYPYRRGGRERGSNTSFTNGRGDQLDSAVRASIESASTEDAVRESLAISASRNRAGPGSTTGIPERSSHIEPDADATPNLVVGDGEGEPSRYLAAVHGAGPSALGDEAFPPLPGTSKSARRRAKLKSQGPASMAALLGGGGSGRGGIRVLNTADNRASGSISRPASWHAAETSPANQSLSLVNRREIVDTSASVKDEVGPGRSFSSMGGPGPPPVVAQGTTGGGNSSISNGASQQDPSGSREVYAVDLGGIQNSRLHMEELRASNKALVERIRKGLKSNEQQFSYFKDVSSQFRKGEMSASDYYVHIAHLGLSYVVPELARLCPDPNKGKELLYAHSAGLTSNIVDPRNLPPGLSGLFSSSLSLDGVCSGVLMPNNARYSDQGISRLQETGVSQSAVTGSRSSDSDVVEVLSTDGYRKDKGKSKFMDAGVSATSSHTVPSTEGTLLNELAAARDRPQVLVRATPAFEDLPQASTMSHSSKASGDNGWACGVCTLVNTASSIQCAVCGYNKPGLEEKNVSDSSGVNEKRKKKVPKFHRLRLGGESDSLASSDGPLPHVWMQPSSESENETRNSSRPAGRGVWNNGGGQRLVSLVQKEAVIDDAWSHGK